MLVNKCYLRDIRDFEESTNMNILDLFNCLSFNNLATLIRIFNKGVSEDDAYRMIDNYLEYEKKSPIDAFNEIKEALFGYKIDIEVEDDKCCEDVTKYNFLSDFYMHLCMQLMSLGISYSEFWSLTTKEMYQVFNAIQRKIINDFNREMQMAYISAGLTGGAIWGKLPNEVPKIDADGLGGGQYIDHPKYGKIKVSDLETIRALEMLGG